jgi:alpha-D-ribose 1-methylphosphonate 5-triphosphate synthase subunit PhnH
MNSELQTQQVFRTVMRAMGNPGGIYRLGDHRARKTGSLQLVAETLFDQDVTFCAVGDPPASEIEDMLYERTKSPVTDLSLADFIIVTGGTSKGRLLAAKRGTPEYPDRGATVLFSVESLTDGNAGDFLARLSGPGISSEKYIQIRGLDCDELHHLRELNGGYPLGVDSIFIDKKGCIMCMPRSTKIQLR